MCLLTTPEEEGSGGVEEEDMRREEGEEEAKGVVDGFSAACFFLAGQKRLYHQEMGTEQQREMHK